MINQVKDWPYKGLRIRLHLLLQLCSSVPLLMLLLLVLIDQLLLVLLLVLLSFRNYED